MIDNVTSDLHDCSLSADSFELHLINCIKKHSSNFAFMQNGMTSEMEY